MLKLLNKIDKKTFILYKKIIFISIIIAPFLNRYNISPVNLLIACLLGFFIGVLICVFHYELFYQGERPNFGFVSINRLSFFISIFVIAVDAIGRGFMVGMMKMHWVLHLILMALVYLFLGAVIVAESTRDNLPVLKVILRFVLILFCVRTLCLFLLNWIFATSFLYTYAVFTLSSLIGIILLIPGAIIGYKKREYFKSGE